MSAEQELRRLESWLHARKMHPDFEYETTDGPRKAFDDSDKPPPGDGWERNTDAGRDGWERFDYHEESYWRRRMSPEEVALPEWERKLLRDQRATQ